MSQSETPPDLRIILQRKKLSALNKARILTDCPRCGARPPVAHAQGGGPGFDGFRVCGHCGHVWDEDDRKEWTATRDYFKDQLQSPPVQEPAPEATEDTPEPTCMHFQLTEEQQRRVEEFSARVDKERGTGYAGAIGGATTFMFTPTSLGVIIAVKHFGEVLDLTDYDSW